MDIEVIYAGLANFFDTQFIELIIATIGLFLITYIIWWMYKILSRRNIFTLKSESKTHPSTADHVKYLAKYFLSFPFITFLGFLAFALSLFILIKPADIAAQEQIIFVAIVIISAIRVSAYVSEPLAEDLAKLLPLAVLVSVLTNPSFNFGISLAQIETFFMLIPGFLKYLIFTVTLEVLLRGFTWLARNWNAPDPLKA